MGPGLAKFVTFVRHAGLLTSALKMSFRSVSARAIKGYLEPV